jgi:hypothetical protein
LRRSPNGRPANQARTFLQPQFPDCSGRFELLNSRSDSTTYAHTIRKLVECLILYSSQLLCGGYPYL